MPQEQNKPAPQAPAPLSSKSSIQPVYSPDQLAPFLAKGLTVTQAKQQLESQGAKPVTYASVAPNFYVEEKISGLPSGSTPIINKAGEVTGYVDTVNKQSVLLPASNVAQNAQAITPAGTPQQKFQQAVHLATISSQSSTQPSPLTEKFINYTQQQAQKGDIIGNIVWNIAPRFTLEDPIGLRTIGTLAYDIGIGKSIIQTREDIMQINREALADISNIFDVSQGKLQTFPETLQSIGTFTIKSPVAQVGLFEIGGEITGGLAKPVIQAVAPTLSATLGETIVGKGFSYLVEHPKIVETVGLGTIGIAEGIKATEMKSQGISPPIIFAQVGSDIANVVGFGTGLSEGLLKGFPVWRDIKDFISGKEFISAKKITEPQILSGNEIFPSSYKSPSQLVKEFYTSPYRLEEGAGGYHATATPPILRAGVFPVGIGRSESPGLFVAPSLSPHFLRLTTGEEGGARLITGVEKPEIFYIIPKDVQRFSSDIKNMGKKAMNQFLLSPSSSKTSLYISPSFELGIKIEKEAIVPPQAMAQLVLDKKFTRVFGANVPIKEFKLADVTTPETVPIKSLKFSSLSKYARSTSIGLGLVSASSIVGRTSRIFASYPYNYSSYPSVMRRISSPSSSIRSSFSSMSSSIASTPSIISSTPSIVSSTTSIISSTPSIISSTPSIISSTTSIISSTPSIVSYPSSVSSSSRGFASQFSSFLPAKRTKRRKSRIISRNYIYTPTVFGEFTGKTIKKTPKYIGVQAVGIRYPVMTSRSSAPKIQSNASFLGKLMFTPPKERKKNSSWSKFKVMKKSFTKYFKNIY